MNQAAHDHRHAVELADRYLHSRRFQILGHSWAGTTGTADLIAAEDDVLVIVDVRPRARARRGTPLESTITRRRLNQLRTVAHAWMTTTGTRYDQVRIDVIGVVINGGSYSLEHIRQVG